MSIKSNWKNFKESKWYSRKLAIVIAGIVLTIIFPDSGGSVATIIGLFCGANVAQKFTSTVGKVSDTVQAAKDLADEAIKSSSNEKNT